MVLCEELGHRSKGSGQVAKKGRKMGVECEYTHASNRTALRILTDTVQHVTVQ